MNKYIYIFMLAVVLSGCDKMESVGATEHDINHALGDVARNAGRSVIQLGMSNDIAKALAACNQQAAGNFTFYDFDPTVGGPRGKSYTVGKSNEIEFFIKNYNYGPVTHACSTVNGVVVSIY